MKAWHTHCPLSSLMKAWCARTGEWRKKGKAREFKGRTQKSTYPHWCRSATVLGIPWVSVEWVSYTSWHTVVACLLRFLHCIIKPCTTKHKNTENHAAHWAQTCLHIILVLCWQTTCAHDLTNNSASPPMCLRQRSAPCATPETSSSSWL